jgi:starch synthase
VTGEALAGALSRTADLWSDRDGWTELIVNGMTTDVGWRRPAKRYARLYRDLVAARAA